MKKIVFLGLAFVLLVVSYILYTRIYEDPYIYNFKKENSCVYKLSFTQNSLLYKSEFNPREITLEYKVSADLNARVLHEDKNYSWTLYELSAFKLEGVGISPEVLEALRPYYESMFLVKYDVSGKILEMNFSAMKENVVGLEQLTYLLEMINLEFCR